MSGLIGINTKITEITRITSFSEAAWPCSQKTVRSSRVRGPALRTRGVCYSVSQNLNSWLTLVNSRLVCPLSVWIPRVVLYVACEFLHSYICSGALKLFAINATEDNKDNLCIYLFTYLFIFSYFFNLYLSLPLRMKYFFYEILKPTRPSLLKAIAK